MKLILFKGFENQLFLNVEKILIIYHHKFANYTEIKITLNNKYSITIIDHNHTDFAVSYLHNFIQDPERYFEVLPVEDFDLYENSCSFFLKDWVSVVMKRS